MAAKSAAFGKNMIVLSLALAAAIAGYAAANGSWLKHMPEADRAMKNPYAGQADAIAAGGRVFEDHCAKCHGRDAEGHGKKPSLRSARVQGATDGEIFWLLKNGELAKGMPTWNKLPDDTRWQVIAYLKSLGKGGLFSYSGGPHKADGR
ncbi:MAG: c-type cytochrome [Candidatus Acidiferrum sp.]